MKILHTVSSIASEAAGTSYTVPSLVKALVNEGHELRLLSLGESEITMEDSVYYQRFRQNFNAVPFLSRLGISFPLKSYLLSQAENSEIYHTHGLWMMPNIYPAQATSKKFGKYVISTRGMLAPSALEHSKIRKKIFWRLLQKFAFERASLIHVTSEQELIDIRNFGIRQPAAVIPNGVELPERCDFVLDTSPNNEIPRKLIYLGRLHPIKRIEKILFAWQCLQNKYPNWEVKIYGPGDAEYVAYLESIIKQKDLKRCAIEGAVFGERKFDVIREASLSVLPSDSENFAMTVAESLILATPVLVSQGAPWNGVLKNSCGWWVDHSLDAWITSIDAAMCLSDAELRTLGINGREWMKRDFLWQPIAQKMTTAYEWVLHGGSVPQFVHL